MTDFYAWMVWITLGVAAFINLYRPGMLFLVSFTAFVLAILPDSLPDPALMGWTWFPLLISVEFAFACLSLCTMTYAGKVIAAFSVLNSIGHCLGWAAYYYDLSIYSHYESIIRFGEISQLLSLILFSPLIDFLLQAYQDRKLPSHDRNKLEYSSC